jgi:carboxymethylenebutenolidase
MSHPQPEGYLATPPKEQDQGQRKGVLVLHAWWGLNETIKELCRRLAAEGFVVFAPDLYHGKVAKTIPEAEQYGGELEANSEQAKADVAAAAAYLRTRVSAAGNDLAVLAISLGAYFAADLAAADPEHIRSVVLFYGSGDTDVAGSQAAYLVHYAENDPYEPPIYAEKFAAALKAAARPAACYVYPGTTHWFFEADRVEEYNEAAANLAWARTIAFLKRPTTA